MWAITKGLPSGLIKPILGIKNPRTDSIDKNCGGFLMKIDAKAVTKTKLPKTKLTGSGKIQQSVSQRRQGTEKQTKTGTGNQGLDRKLTC